MYLRPCEAICPWGGDEAPRCSSGPAILFTHTRTRATSRRRLSKGTARRLRSPRKATGLRVTLHVQQSRLPPVAGVAHPNTLAGGRAAKGHQTGWLVGSRAAEPSPRGRVSVTSAPCLHAQRPSMVTARQAAGRPALSMVAAGIATLPGPTRLRHSRRRAHRAWSAVPLGGRVAAPEGARSVPGGRRAPRPSRTRSRRYATLNLFARRQSSEHSHMMSFCATHGPIVRLMRRRSSTW